MYCLDVHRAANAAAKHYHGMREVERLNALAKFARAARDAGDTKMEIALDDFILLQKHYATK